MDKYEFNIKVEQIKKMVSRSDYETAMKIADTIDWRRVRNVNILSMVATIYEKNEEYQEAKDILLLAFERAPIGKRLLFKLAELAIKEGSFQEAEDYYREFCDLAADDPRQYILRYLILGAKGAPVEQLIHTLEQYCNIELDEKWLYELAELYAEANMGDLCVMTCDKIMLMFGLGKYVEKAMELKIQFAPLTKYQMDLVENRDKYEAKLKAVEQEFRTGTRSTEFDDVPERKGGLSVPAYMAHGEAAAAREPQGEYPEESYPEENYPEEGYPEESYPEERYSEESYAGEGYPQEEYGDGAYTDQGQPGDGAYADQRQSGYAYRNGWYKEEDPEEEYEGDEETGDYEPHAQVTIEPEEPDDSETAEALPEEDIEPQWMPEDTAQNMSDEAVRARIHEAEVQANLAMEMSRISEVPDRPEQALAQTRVLTDIRELTRENPRREAHHLMIEAAAPSAGLQQAVEILKKIHRETGAKNQAAKITGEKLNSKGLFAIADKLTGKDLIIEQAGIIEESILQELNQLMARDETGMNVVLIDDAANLAHIHKVYPGLAKRFEYIGDSAQREAAGKVKPDSGRPVRQVQVRPSQDIPPKRAPKKVEKPASEPSSVPASAPAQPPKPVKAKKERHPEPIIKAPVQPQPQEEEPEYVDHTEMDIDEFAKYACQYASDIDCSISGKSMLALYERIEIMEEDGIKLTKPNAEDLIEEAADRAENPSFFKKLTGIFSSRYDRDGLLILKEEHFI